jgi:hypothetical protein
MQLTGTNKKKKRDGLILFFERPRHNNPLIFSGYATFTAPALASRGSMKMHPAEKAKLHVHIEH